MSCVIVIMRRAMAFCGLVSSSRLVPSLSWQYTQWTPSEISINCIDGCINSAGNPLSTWTFLKNVSVLSLGPDLEPSSTAPPCNLCGDHGRD